MKTSSYVERTTALSTRVDAKLLEIFRHVIFEKTGMQKGDLSKSIEEAMLLYIQKHVANQAALPVAELYRRRAVDKDFAEYLDRTGMTVFDLVITAIAVYMKMQEQTRHKIRRLQIENNMAIDEAVEKTLNSK